MISGVLSAAGRRTEGTHAYLFKGTDSRPGSRPPPGASLARGANPLDPLRAEQSSVHQKPQHLPGKDISQSPVVQAWGPVEGPRLVHAALGHQEMQVRVKVDPKVFC